MVSTSCFQSPCTIFKSSKDIYSKILSVYVPLTTQLLAPHFQVGLSLYFKKLRNLPRATWVASVPNDIDWASALVCATSEKGE